MKANWYTDADGLIYTGMDYLGYVKPTIVNNKILYSTWFYEGDGSENRRKTPVIKYNSLDQAINVTEKFFELNITDQREQFRMLLKS